VSRTEKKKTEPQLTLFGEPEAKADKEAPRVQALVTDEARAIAEKLPRSVRFGTSSWTFPGWGGILYAGTPSQTSLVAHGLRAYAEHPLFRTVGIDRSYYGPLTADDLAGYARALRESGADGFRAVSKVWDELTTYTFPAHPRFGARAGQRNESFLDPKRFVTEVLAAYEQSFAEYMGPFVVEVPPVPKDALLNPRAFVAKVDAFLSEVGGRARFAFELRNRELLVPDYFRVLARHGASHVFNYWTAMPDIRQQLSLQGAFTADFVVSRLMLPPGMKYEDQKQAYEPFNRIVTAQEGMRRDVVALIARAMSAGASDVFVLVNNKAEGCSPLTVMALAELVGKVVN
jgi:uncharacterized protein YecE (DUF72 family)